MANGTTQTQLPAVTPAKGPLPFRRATVERTEQLESDTVTLGANEVKVRQVVEGSGFIYGIDLHVIGSGGAHGGATVAVAEDFPYNALSSVILKDANGELVNVDGFNLKLLELMAANYKAMPSWNAFDTADTVNGNFDFHLRVPVGVNRRSLLGILGNQDRAQKYDLRDNVADSGTLYTTAPATLPAVDIVRHYENYGVPPATSPAGVPQSMLPDGFGTLHYGTSYVSEFTPQPGAKKTYLRNIGKTFRGIILVFRSNGSRASADANAPSLLSWKVGDSNVFSEDYAYRRRRMREQYGFDWPAGVLVYDRMEDFVPGAGNEIGDDYWHTQSISNLSVDITYPTGFGSTNNSLTIVQDELAYAAPAKAAA